MRTVPIGRAPSSQKIHFHLSLDAPSSTAPTGLSLSISHRSPFNRNSTRRTRHRLFPASHRFLATSTGTRSVDGLDAFPLFFFVLGFGQTTTGPYFGFKKGWIHAQ